MTKTYIKYRTRITFVAFFILISWISLCARLFQIQVLNGEHYQNIVIKQSQKKQLIPAVRGNIFDRHNKPLTRNIIHYTLSVNPSKVKNKIELAEIVSKSTGSEKEKYLKKLNSNSRFEYLERNIQREELGPLQTTSIQGLNIERKYRRYYPHNEIAAQILGYTNLDEEGISGIEKDFNKYLKGDPGWIYKTKGWSGKVQHKNGMPFKLPINGNNIQLTIDLEYQSILEQELLKRQIKTRAVSATGIIMDPETGEILAMASTPGFNNNNFVSTNPEFHRIKSITDQFEPGSTYKVVSAVSGLNNNIISLQDEFNCENGVYKYYTIEIKDHGQENGYGMLTLPQIIHHSSNIGIIKMIERVGPKILYTTSRDFGFGSRTGVTLNGEVHGKLSPFQNWSAVSLGQIAMGHEVGVTAIQLATAYCAIANGGYLLKPRIIKQIIDDEENVLYKEDPTVIRKISDSKTIEHIRKMLRGVIINGTGRNANIDGWEIAGKTGTAQKWHEGKYSNKQFISNFVGFLPHENPQLLGFIMLDEPKQPYHWGNEGAAVAFNKVMKRIINMDDTISPPKKRKKYNNDISKNEYLIESEKAVANDLSAVSTITRFHNKTSVPEIRGLSIRKALHTLEQNDLKFKLRGSGKVSWQNPTPGTIVNKGTVCTIGLK